MANTIDLTEIEKAQLTDDDLEKLKANGVRALPVNPTASGWDAKAIMRQMYKQPEILFHWMRRIAESAMSLGKSVNGYIEGVSKGKETPKVYPSLAQAVSDMQSGGIENGSVVIVCDGDDLSMHYASDTGLTQIGDSLNGYQARLAKVESDSASHESKADAKAKLDEAKAYAEEKSSKALEQANAKTEEEVYKIKIGDTVVAKAKGDENGEGISETYFRKDQVANDLSTLDSSKALSAEQGAKLKGFVDAIHEVLRSDDSTLDSLQELVSYVKSNKTLIESITTTKVSYSDIVDALTSAEKGKPLSANMGRELKSVADALERRVTQGEASLSGKANVDGSYETLHAGTASDLTSESGLPVEGIFRETPLPVATGDGLLTISEIRGHTAKNVRNLADFPSSSSIEHTEGNVYSNNSNATFVPSHKYLLSFVAKFQSVPKNAGPVLFGFWNKEKTEFARYQFNYSSANKYETIVNASSLDTSSGFDKTTVQTDLIFVLQLLGNAEDTVFPSYSDIQVIDLTDIYGAGNEPSTVSRFRMDFPEYIPYEAQARLVPGTADSFNGMPLPVLSSPLLSAGNARDSMTPEGKIVRRVKVVEDMSALPWEYYSANSTFRVNIVGMAKGVYHTPSNLVSDVYQTTQSEYGNDPMSVDKAIFLWSTQSVVVVRDTSFSDLDSFKASLKGKTLYYELETPVEEAGQPFGKALKVKAGGSVSFEGGNGYPLRLSAIAQKSIKNFAEALGNEVGWEPSKLVSQPSYAVPIAVVVSNPKIKKNEFVLRVEENWLEIDAQITYESDGTVWTWDVLANTSVLPKDVWKRLTPLKDESDAVHVGTIMACSSSFANDTPKFGLFYVKKSSNVGYLGIFKPNFALPNGSHEISLHSRIPLKEVTQ